MQHFVFRGIRGFSRFRTRLTLAVRLISAELPATALFQFLQFLQGCGVSVSSSCPQQDSCLFTIPANPVASQIELRKRDFRRGVARSYRGPELVYGSTPPPRRRCIL